MGRVGSMLKYFQELGGPGSNHGGRLHWPGTPEGFPFRGDRAPLLRQQEVQQIHHALDFHSRLFCLWEPDDKREFDAVMDRIVNGWFMQHRRVDKEIPGQIAPAVWLEWVQIYGESPQGKNPGSKHDADNTTITLETGRPPAAGTPPVFSPEQLRKLFSHGQTGRHP